MLSRTALQLVNKFTYFNPKEKKNNHAMKLMHMITFLRSARIMFSFSCFPTEPFPAAVFPYYPIPNEIKILP